MATFTTKDGAQVYYRDWRKGQPIVFSHGWPLTGDAFEDQMFFLASRAYRCIAHDRRGHGRSKVSFDSLVVRSVARHLRFELTLLLQRAASQIDLHGKIQRNNQVWPC